MAALARLKTEHVELSATLSKKEHVLAAPAAAETGRGDNAAMLLSDPEEADQSGSEARTAGANAEEGTCGGSAGKKRQRRCGSESSGGESGGIIGGRSLLSGVGSAMAEWRQQAAGRMRQAPDAEVSGIGVAAGTGKSSISMPMPAMGSVMQQVAADETHLDDGRHGEVDGRRGCLLVEDLDAGEGGGCDGSRCGAAGEGVHARLQANLKEQVAAMVRCVQAVLLPWPAEQRVRTSLLLYPRSLGMPDFIAVIAAAASGSGPVALPDAEDGQDLWSSG